MQSVAYFYTVRYRVFLVSKCQTEEDVRLSVCLFVVDIQHG